MNRPQEHISNVALRFALELAALAGIGIGAWAVLGGWMRWIGVVGAPVAAAVAWGTFNVPNDPSRSGAAPVPVSGWTRLLVEFVVFGAGWAGWQSAGHTTVALVFLIGLIVHHGLSIPRLRWLISQARTTEVRTE